MVHIVSVPATSPLPGSIPIRLHSGGKGAGTKRMVHKVHATTFNCHCMGTYRQHPKVAPLLKLLIVLSDVGLPVGERELPDELGGERHLKALCTVPARMRGCREGGRDGGREGGRERKQEKINVLHSEICL